MRAAQVVGAVLLIAGIVLSIGYYINLALNDLEFAKHNESLYAIFRFIYPYGWIFIVLIVAGFILIAVGDD